MKANIFLLTPAALLGSAVAGHGVNYLTAEQAQHAIFPGKAMTPDVVKLTSDQRKAIEKQSGIRQRGDTVKAWRVAGGGWFIVDEVLGKHEFITFAMGISADGAVRGIEVMEYRETYGDQIRNPKWRAQFTGKTNAATLKLDVDIRNISGATLSCRHITDGVKRLLAVYDAALKSR